METSQAEGGTRSGLLWEVERILDELKTKNTLPKVLLMENVPEVVGTGNIQHFQKWRAKLESLGYSNFGNILVADDYYIPQKRRRYFMISILGEYSYEFPRKMHLDYEVERDFLDKPYNEKYFLTQEHIERVSNWKAFEKPLELIEENMKVIGTLTTHVNKDSAGMKIVGIPIKNATKQGYTLAQEGDCVDCSGRMQYHRGTVQKGKCQTILTGSEIGVVVRHGQQYAIKLLSPCEQLKLMGFTPEVYKSLDEANLSESAIGHIAGDSIVTTCIMALLNPLINEEGEHVKIIQGYVTNEVL